MRFLLVPDGLSKSADEARQTRSGEAFFLDLLRKEHGVPPQPGGITGRGHTEHAPVIAAELGRAVIPDGKTGFRRVIPVRHQTPPRLLQPDAGPVLHRAHQRHRLEMPKQRRRAHTGEARQIVDPELLGIMRPHPGHDPGNPGQVAVRHRDRPKPNAQRAPVSRR